MPASSAAWDGVRSRAARLAQAGALGRHRWPGPPGRPVGVVGRRAGAAEVGARGGLHAVGPVAEVDAVQVLGQHLLLGPLALQVVGQRGLAQLLEHGPLGLGGQRVLHELLGDGGAALHGAAAQHVLGQGAGDALVVHALVLVEAAVLDGDHRVLHVGGDVGVLDQDPVLVAGQLGQVLGLLALAGRLAEQRRVLRPAVLGAVLQLRQVAGDRHHHPEHRRDHGQGAQHEQHRAPGAASSAWAWGRAGRRRSPDACDASGEGTCEGVIVVGGSGIGEAREKGEVPQRGPCGGWRCGACGGGGRRRPASLGDGAAV